MQTLTKKMTASEYEKLPEGPPQQLIEGELLMTPAPSSSHQLIAGEIYSFIKDFANKNESGIVIFSPVDVYLTESDVYQPDIIFISNEQKNIIGEKIKGVPDLVVEILSPSTAYYDLIQKKHVYEETGVKEFWVVDPEGKSVEIYENVRNAFILFSKARVSGVVNSKILSGLEAEIEKFFSHL